jgi:hypothetical protein
MAIQHSLTTAFKEAMLQTLAGHDVRIALYTDAASIGAGTPAYTTSGEVAAPGYTAGGASLTGFTTVVEGEVAYATWDTPVVWPNSTITARGALLYDADEGNRALAVIDFGRNVASTDDDFKVKLPVPGATTALVRVV